MIVLDRSADLLRFLDTSALRYSNVVFDGFRVDTSSNSLRCVKPNEHFVRFLGMASSAGLRVKATPSDLRKALIAVAEQCRSFPDCHFRLFALASGERFEPECDATVYCFPLRQRPVATAKVRFASTLRFSFDRIYTRRFIKTPANYMLCLQAAKQSGMSDIDELVLVDESGLVTECARSAIFFFAGDEFVFPRARASILDSVTRRVVLNILERQVRYRTSVRDVSVRELGRFESALLCSSSNGIEELSRVDDFEYRHTGVAEELSVKYAACLESP